jgi:two-component system chemotaxis response regulator CheY
MESDVPAESTELDADIESATPTPPSPTTGGILLADDSFAGRQLLTRILERLSSARLHEVRDGTTALEAFQLLRPRITLLDIDMPAPDGLAVLEQIRAIDPAAYVIIVSAHSRLETVRRAVDLGVGGFVVKPYSMRRIEDALCRYVEQTGDVDMLRIVPNQRSS